MKNCYDCNHCEVCKWIDEFKDKDVCDFYNQGQNREPSGDLISRQASISKIKELFSLGDCYCDEYSIVGTLNGMPPVTLPPKTGHWISDVFVDECSVCGEQTLFFEDQQKNFCPNCGAKMVEPQESEE